MDLRSKLFEYEKNLSNITRNNEDLRAELRKIIKENNNPNNAVSSRQVSSEMVNSSDVPILLSLQSENIGLQKEMALLKSVIINGNSLNDDMKLAEKEKEIEILRMRLEGVRGHSETRKEERKM